MRRSGTDPTRPVRSDLLLPTQTWPRMPGIGTRIRNNRAWPAVSEFRIPVALSHALVSKHRANSRLHSLHSGKEMTKRKVHALQCAQQRPHFGPASCAHSFFFYFFLDDLSCGGSRARSKPPRNRHLRRGKESQSVGVVDHFESRETARQRESQLFATNGMSKK